MYNKLFTKILDSSIWLESEHTRIIWLTFIASMDQDGFAQFASVRNLAHRARVSEEDTAAAVAILEAPDTESSDPDNDGRRVEKVPGGWMVLNSQKYKELVTAEFARENNRIRVKRHRAKKQSVTPCNDLGVTCNASETEAETETKEEASPNGSLPSLSTNGEAAKGLIVSCKPKKPSPIPNRVLFRNFWNGEYLKFFGKCYLPGGSKDDKAIDKFLDHYQAEEVIDTAKSGWRSLNPYLNGKSRSIAGLQIVWGDLQALKNPAPRRSPNL